MLSKILSEFFLEIFEKHYCKRKKGYTQKLEWITHKWSYLVLFSPLSFYSVHFDPSQCILVLFCQFSSITSILFSPFWFTSVQFGYIRSIQSTLVLFNSLRSYSVRSILSNPLWSYLVYFDSIRSTLLLFNPFEFFQSTYLSYLVHFGHIQFFLVYFDPILSTLVHLVLFGPFVSSSI